MLHLTEDLIIDYAHGALDAVSDADAFAHLEVCLPCRTMYNEELAMRDMLRMRAQAEEREFPESLRNAVFEKIAADARGGILVRLRTALRPALLGVAAAVAAFVIVPHMTPQASHTAANVNVASFFSSHDAAAADVPLTEHTSVAEIENAAFNGSDTNDTNADSAN